MPKISPGATGKARRRSFPNGSTRPNAWPINHGQWSELSEGFLGPDYVNLVPDWFKSDYATYYPTLDQIKTNFKQIDWTAYNASAKVWQDYYGSKIGQ